MNCIVSAVYPNACIRAISVSASRPATAVPAGRQVGEFDAFTVEPGTIRPRPGPLRLDLFVRDQTSLVEVDEEDLAGLQPSLGHHPRRVQPVPTPTSDAMMQRSSSVT